MNESKPPLQKMGAPISDNEARSAIHAIGGYVYQLMGFAPLILAWAPAVVVATLVIARDAGRSAPIAVVQ